jgi:hypothetical protein
MAMHDERDLRQAKVAAELLAADDRFNSWELANKERAAEQRARRVAGAQKRGAHRLSAPEYQDLLRDRAADGIRMAIVHALKLRLEADEILQIAQTAVAKDPAYTRDPIVPRVVTGSRP